MKITAEMALDGLTVAVHQRGALYVDPEANAITGLGCKYQRKGAPSCIAGSALHHVGVPVDVLKGLDKLFDSAMGSMESRKFLADAGFDLTPAAERRLSAAQVAQDAGRSWGVALTEAQDLDEREGATL